MNSFIKKISMVGILICCMNCISAMDEIQNSGGGEPTVNNLYNTPDMYTIIITDGSNQLWNTVLFQQEATLNEINRYAILQYFFYHNFAIESNQPVDYYLKRMHELISSIMQFQRNMKNDENGYYNNLGKWCTYSLSRDSIQQIFCIAFEQIIIQSSNSLQIKKLCSDKNNYVYALVDFSNTYRDSILTNSRNIKQEELLNIYNKFRDILYKYMNHNNQNA